MTLRSVSLLLAIAAALLLVRRLLLPLSDVAPPPEFHRVPPGEDSIRGGPVTTAPETSGASNRRREERRSNVGVRVVTSSGSSIEGARVRRFDRAGSILLGEATTDRAGRVTFAAGHGDSTAMTLDVAASGYASKSVLIDGWPAEDVIVELAFGSDARIRIVGQDGASGIGEPVVELLASARGPASSARLSTTWNAATGILEVWGLDEGESILCVDARGHMPRCIRVWRSRVGPPFVAELGATELKRIRVLTKDGAPAAGASTEIRQAVSGVVLGEGLDFLIATGTVGETGTVHLEVDPATFSLCRLVVRYGGASHNFEVARIEGDTVVLSPAIDPRVLEVRDADGRPLECYVRLADAPFRARLAKGGLIEVRDPDVLKEPVVVTLSPSTSSHVIFRATPVEGRVDVEAPLSQLNVGLSGWDSVSVPIEFALFDRDSGIPHVQRVLEGPATIPVSQGTYTGIVRCLGWSKKFEVDVLGPLSHVTPTAPESHLRVDVQGIEQGRSLELRIATGRGQVVDRIELRSPLTTLPLDPELRYGLVLTSTIHGDVPVATWDGTADPWRPEIEEGLVRLRLVDGSGNPVARPLAMRSRSLGRTPFDRRELSPLQTSDDGDRVLAASAGEYSLFVRSHAGWTSVCEIVVNADATRDYEVEVPSDRELALAASLPAGWTGSVRVIDPNERVRFEGNLQDCPRPLVVGPAPVMVERLDGGVAVERLILR